MAKTYATGSRVSAPLCSRHTVRYMAIKTRLTAMLGIEHPVMLAGMGGVSYHQLVAAVSAAGGIGTIGAATMGSDEMEAEMRGVRELTDKPFGVDLLAALPERMVDDA